MEQEKFWVGVAFAGALVVLLGIAIFLPLQKHANNILRLLGAICAGASGAFMTGSTLIQIRGDVAPGMSALIQATGGVVLFLIVWWQWGLKLPPATVLRTAANWTFRQTVAAIAQLEHSIVEFRNFNDDQLDAPVGDHILRGKTLFDVLLALRSAVTGTAIPSFDVSQKDDKYILAAAIGGSGA